MPSQITLRTTFVYAPDTYLCLFFPFLHSDLYNINGHITTGKLGSSSEAKWNVGAFNIQKEKSGIFAFSNNGDFKYWHQGGGNFYALVTLKKN